MKNLQHFVMFTLVVAALSSPVKEATTDVQDVDFFRGLLQETDYLDKFNKSLGINELAPALEFNGNHVIIVGSSNLAFMQTLKKFSCNTKQLLAYASVKFDSAVNGEVFSLRTSNNATFLSLEFQAAEDNIKIDFTHSGQMSSASFQYKFDDREKWYKVSVLLSGLTVSLYVDCAVVGEKIIPDLPEYCLPEDFHLSIGNNSFKGYLQDTGISYSKNAIETHCPQVLPVCQNSAPMVSSKIAIAELESSLAIADADIKKLNNKITMLESKLMKSSGGTCFANGQQYNENEFYWENNSRLCLCTKGGKPVCTNLNDVTSIPSPGCIDPEHPDDSVRQCRVIVNGITYTAPLGHVAHATSPDKSRCMEKVCLTVFGQLFFSTIKYHTCSDFQHLRNCSNAANWTLSEQEIAKCCGHCDVCTISDTECHENATCESCSNNDKYTCKCNEGYYGDGIECKDINECSNGFAKDFGHICPPQAECINTMPGFQCKCPSGYQFIDNGLGSTCSDINECLEESPCKGNNKTCVNMQGSYKCVCEKGYTRNNESNQCIPECDPPCQSGGICVEPGKCECPEGVKGDNCEEDIDECEDAETNDCSPNAKCVNFHNGYFCVCNATEGYYGNGKQCHQMLVQSGEQ